MSKPLTALEKIKKLDEQRQQIIESEKQKQLKKLEENIDFLKQLGFNYNFKEYLPKSEETKQAMSVAAKERWRKRRESLETVTA